MLLWKFNEGHRRTLEKLEQEYNDRNKMVKNREGETKDKNTMMKENKTIECK